MKTFAFVVFPQIKKIGLLNYIISCHKTKFTYHNHMPNKQTYKFCSTVYKAGVSTPNNLVTRT